VYFCDRSDKGASTLVSIEYKHQPSRKGVDDCRAVSLEVPTWRYDIPNPTAVNYSVQSRRWAVCSWSASYTFPSKMNQETGYGEVWLLCAPHFPSLSTPMIEAHPHGPQWSDFFFFCNMQYLSALYYLGSRLNERALKWNQGAEHRLTKVKQLSWSGKSKLEWKTEAEVDAMVKLQWLRLLVGTPLSKAASE
jgi:hypothetical protein